MIKGLDYVGLTTRDVPRARAFFRDKLGLQTEEDQGDAFSQFTTRHGSMWALMLAWSKPWLDRFAYGPFEWLWRSLARWEVQPMRRRLRVPAAAKA